MKRHSIFAVRVFAAMVLAIGVGDARAQTFSVLYDFGATGDPLSPSYEGIIAQGRDANLYSTSPNANSSANGTVFAITPSGTLTVPYYFTEGNVPKSGLTLGTDGYFYGTTVQANNDSGEVFKVTPSGSLIVLHTFTNGDDGGAPVAPPIEGADGNLYGTTTTGGANGWGTVYKLTPSGTFTTIYSFVDYAHGVDPWAPLVQGTDGNFYEATYEGGSSSGGVFFRITPSGKFTLLYNFSGIVGPVGPLVQGSDGNFYGTTSQGGANGLGAIFKLTPGGKLTVLHNFRGQDGSGAYAGLTLANDGNFYGATYEGGNSTNCQSGCGAIFRISPKGKFTVLYNFDMTTGMYPFVTLIQHTNGILYGDTARGGISKECTQGCGVFFSLNMGLNPFVSMVLASGKVGSTAEILGQGFTGTKAVSFNGTAASFNVVSDTYLTATVPSGATTGSVTVTTPGGVLTSNKAFRVTPQIKSFKPSSGPVGTQVTITGVSLTQTTKVTFGGVAATNFTVNSDTQVTAYVPMGAKTGHIAITTPGGVAVSKDVFTVTQ